MLCSGYPRFISAAREAACDPAVAPTVTVSSMSGVELDEILKLNDPTPSM